MPKHLNAFPEAEYWDEKLIGQIPGMTLRDYFAAAVMQGLCARTGAAIAAPGAGAEAAYAVADAMIAQRAK
jgi:hypothetical protein